MNIEVDDLRNEIKVEAVAGDGAFEVEAFAEVYARRLEDAEAVADLNVEPLRCNGPRGKRLELLGYAESSIEQSLVILAGRYFGSDENPNDDGCKGHDRARNQIHRGSRRWLADKKPGDVLARVGVRRLFLKTNRRRQSRKDPNHPYH